VVSYSHIEGLALAQHQPLPLARLFPFAVDGLIAAGSVVVLAGEWRGWLAMVPGIVATLFANVESGIRFGWLAAIVAGWPAIAFSVASYVLERHLRSQVKDVPDVAPDGPAPEPAPAEPEPAAALNGHAPGTAWAQPASAGWS
jgi:hypothetical protein